MKSCYRFSLTVMKQIPGSRFWQHYDFQVEAIKLSSQSAIKQLEAEIASSKRDAAQAAATHKAAAAAWVSDTDGLKAEVRTTPTTRTFLLSLHVGRKDKVLSAVNARPSVGTRT